MSRTWQDNAAEFAALDQGEGWPFAILVACSVEPKSAAHRPGSIAPGAKVSARQFAEVAGTTHKRVMLYLAAWDRAADDLVVPDASSLTPEDAHTTPIPDAQFGGKGGYYDGSAQGGGLPTDRVQATKATTLVEKMTPEQKVEVAATIIREATADPTDRGVLGKIEEAADIAPVNTMEQMRDAIRTNKERDAVTTPIRDQVPHLKRILMYLDVECGQDTELWQGVYDHVALRLAEYAVDGRISGVRS